MGGRRTREVEERFNAIAETVEKRLGSVYPVYLPLGFSLASFFLKEAPARSQSSGLVIFVSGYRQ